MRFKQKGSGEETEVKLQHGDVLIMNKSSQQYYLHSIPKDRCRGTGISITFRKLKLETVQVHKLIPSYPVLETFF